MAIVFTDANFQQEVLEYKGIVLVDFWAPWCGPCQMMGPVIEELVKDYEGKVKIGKLDVDTNPQTAATHNIMSIPALLIFKEGKLAEQLIGLQTKEAIEEKLDSVIG